MSDSISMGSVSERLLSFINTAQIHDSYYDIALTLIRNYEEAKHMPIAKMADLCFVSQATISRFCRFLGYDSFKTFHDDLQKEFSVLNDYTKQFQSMLKSSDEKASLMYRERIVNNIDAALSLDNLTRIRKASDMLAESQRIAFFSHHFLWDTGHFFQTKMIMMDRYVEMYQSYENQMICARSLNETSTAIICTVGGSYFSYYPDLFSTIMNSGAATIILTQNTGSTFTNRADLVIGCGETNQDDTGKYAVLAVLDHLVLQYMKRHHR